MNKASEQLTNLSTTGDPNLAVVAVGRFGEDARYAVETVDALDPPKSRQEKWIINLSTQFGCPVGCPMCDAAGAYHGDLHAKQMLAQVSWALARHPGQAAGCAKLKVHFSRMGEPALNDAVCQALLDLPALVESPGLWACVATVAPKGRADWFDRLLEIQRRFYPQRFQLQLSVQSTDAAARRRLIPFPHLNLDELSRLGLAFHGTGGRKPVLNFALAEDAPFDPMVLSRHFDPKHFAVKLTPINPTTRSEQHGLRTRLRSDTEAEVDAAIDRLRNLGYDVIRSVGDPKEDQIGSNCGQTLRMLLARTEVAINKPVNPTRPPPSAGSRMGA